MVGRGLSLLVEVASEPQHPVCRAGASSGSAVLVQQNGYADVASCAEADEPCLSYVCAVPMRASSGTV